MYSPMQSGICLAIMLGIQGGSSRHKTALAQNARTTALVMAEPGLKRSKAIPSSTSSEGEDDLAEFKSAVLAKLALVVGKDASSATDRDWFVATAHAIRDRIIYR